jgi:hypothetical protein
MSQFNAYDSHGLPTNVELWQSTSLGCHSPFTFIFNLEYEWISSIMQLISWRLATQFESGCTHQSHKFLIWPIRNERAPKIRNVCGSTWEWYGVYLKQQKSLVFKKFTADSLKTSYWHRMKLLSPPHTFVSGENVLNTY